MNLNSFFENTRIDIEKRIDENVDRYEKRDKLAYFLKDGKRLRPLLSILVFRACGGDDQHYESALDLAVAIELQHSASLVHDDIIDGDDRRRSKSSYHNVFGIGDAILMGHRAIVLGFKKVLGHDPKILETFFDVWDKSLEGEIEDFESRKSPLALLMDNGGRYFDVIVNKTASLFAGAAKLGSQEAAAQEELQNLFWEYGQHIGIAYQLVDDKLDLNNGNADVLPISWVARRLDRRSLESLAVSLKDGFSPSVAFSKLDVDVEGIFNEEITKMQRTAENLARNKMVPENKYSSLLAETPGYIIDGCLKS